jgi:hypothetical protein
LKSDGAGSCARVWINGFLFRHLFDVWDYVVIIVMAACQVSKILKGIT